MKESRKKLILTQFFSRLGESLLGLFFPFFLAKTFDLTIPQVFLWGTIFYGAIVLFSNTIYIWAKQKFSGAKILCTGLILLATFYGTLGFDLPKNWWIISVLTVVYSLGLTLFWIEFNTQSFLANKAESRGKFFANYQSVVIGANILSPILTGFLLDRGLGKYSLMVAVFFFLVAIFIGFSIEKFPKTTAPTFDSSWRTQKKLWKNSNLRNGLLALGTSSSFFYVAWSFFFHSVTGDFSSMGIIVGIAAAFEVFSAQVIGRNIKKISLKHIYKVRMLDLSMRALFFVFTADLFVGGIIILSGILGPIFFLPFMNRVHEYANKTENKYEFFIFWENATGVSRFLVCVVLLLASQWLPLPMVYFIGICLSALATFGIRKF